MGSKLYAYDLEVFSNYFLAQFYDGVDYFQFEINDVYGLIDFISDRDKILIGYNNFNYDDVVLKSILEVDGFLGCNDIYETSGRIIGSRQLPRDLFQLQYQQTPWKYSIDLFQLLNKRGSLKEWQCREQMDVVMESPVDFTAPLRKSAIPKTITYCKSDVRSTWDLFQSHKHLAVLREKLKRTYGLTNRVFVTGEAGIAQQVIMALHQQTSRESVKDIRIRSNSSMDNKAKEWSMESLISDKVVLQYPNGADFLREFRTSKVTAKDEHRVKWKLDNEWEIPIIIENGPNPTEFQLGVGGLHSIDSPGSFYADSKYAIIDLDVTSYYPSIIIEENLFPIQLGPSFVQNFTRIRDTRVEAKRKSQAAFAAGDKVVGLEHDHDNQALKIVINSTFGKFNDRYAPIRSIPNAMRVTINGQLFLLMLVEMLHHQAEAVIVSANTDGVTFKIPRYQLPNLAKVQARWEKATGHGLERTDYECYIRRDVNAYVAMTTDGKLKSKGALTAYPMSGKWDNIVSIIAAQNYLTKGVDPAKTIRRHKNPKDFLYYQMVKNGGRIWAGDVEVGKLARWYSSTDGVQIHRVNPNGTKANIPNGESAVLALDTSDWDIFGLPDDIDRDAYVKRAWHIIQSTGAKK